MIRESALLFVTNVLIRGLGIARGIVVARLLAPADYGLLAAMLVTAFYLQALELGVGWGTNREIPLLRGRGKSEQVALVERQVFWWEIAIGTIIGLSLLVLAATLSRTDAWRTIWFALSVYVGSELLRNTLQCFLQAREEFARLRRSMVWQAVVDIVLTATFTALWGLKGAVAGILLTSAALTLYLMWDMRQTRVWKPALISRETVIALAAAGLPLMIQNLMWANMTNVDKLVIMSTVGSESLAYYAMAQTVAASMLLVSTAVSRVNGPLMVRTFGETSDPAELYRVFYRTALILAYGLPMLLASMWLLGPLFFSVVLPRYRPAIRLLDWTSLTFYGMSITLSVSSVYVALGRQVLNGVLLFAGMIATATLSLVLIAQGWGVLGVAFASAVSAAGYLTIFMGIGLRFVGREGRNLAADLARLLFPLAVCGLSVAALGFVPTFGPSRTWLCVAIAAACVGVAIQGTNLLRSDS